MAIPEQKQGAGSTPQISADLLTRMEQVDKEVEGSNSPPAEANFAAILEAIPDGDLTTLSRPSSDSRSEGPRDRNLSDVIARIRDEGPADGEEALADDVLEIGGHRMEGDSKPPAAEDREGSSPVESKVEDLPEPLLKQGDAGERRRGFQVVLNLVLLAGLMLMGYLQYGQMEAENELQQQLELQRRALTEMEQQLTSLEERLARSRPMEKAVVAREELEAILQKHDRSLEQRLALLSAMAVVQQQGLAATKMESVATAKPVKAPANEEADQAAKKPVAGKQPTQQTAARTKEKSWMVVVASSRDPVQARKARNRLRSRLGKVEIRQARVKGQTVYRLVVPGFADKKSALSYRNTLVHKEGLKGAWVGRG